MSSSSTSPSPVSVQLYTVREALADDLPGTLQRLADIGFTQVEPYGFTGLDGLGDGLAAAGLTAPTTHGSIVGQDLESVFARAAELGIGTVIDPHIDGERWLTRDGVVEIAADLNAASAVAARHGVVVGYHNHAHELETLIDGTPALEVLHEHLDPAVILQVDTYWVVVGGQDVVALLHRLGDRVTALHVKDGPGSRDDADQVALGKGSMPLLEIIAAAPTALRVIELDDTRGDRFDAVRDSYDYLVKENLA